MAGTSGIIYNRIIPFKGFTAITILEWIFARSEARPLSKRMVNHERIHIAQCREMLYIGFYIWYIVEFVLRLVQTRGNHRSAYRLISLETEAYDNAGNLEYLMTRKHYCWLRIKRR